MVIGQLSSVLSMYTYDTYIYICECIYICVCAYICTYMIEMSYICEDHCQSDMCEAVSQCA